MTDQRTQYVDVAGKVWGWQWRYHFGDKVSISLTSLAGRVQEEGFHATSGSPGREYPEVFMGQGLEFAAAMKQLNEEMRRIAWVHYVVPLPSKAKAVQLNVSRPTYWRKVDAMRLAMVGALAL